jgi:hypothetical protein
MCAPLWASERAAGAITAAAAAAIAHLGVPQLVADPAQVRRPQLPLLLQRLRRGPTARRAVVSSLL